MARQRPFYNPMSFASELHKEGYIDRPGSGGHTKPPITPERPPAKPGGSDAVRLPGKPMKPIDRERRRDKATISEQRIAGNQGRRLGGRPAVFAKGFQYGARTGRGGRIPVFDQADLARRLRWRESNKYISERITPFIPRNT